MRRSSRAPGCSRRATLGALAGVRRGNGDGSRVPLVPTVLLGTALGILAAGGLGHPARSGLALLVALAAALLVRSSLRLRSELATASHVQEMESAARLANGMTHEINNLMTVVTINAELLGDHVAPQECDLLARIVDAADQAASLSRRLGASGRPVESVRSAIDLNEEIEVPERLVKPVPGNRALDPALTDGGRACTLPV